MRLARVMFPTDDHPLGSCAYPDAVGWSLNPDIARASNVHIAYLATAFRRKQITSADMTVRQRVLVHQRILDDALESVRLRDARRKVA